MDEETRAYLDAIKAELMTQMNNQHERVIDEITTLRADFQNTKGFLVEDALVTGRRLSITEQRVTRLERKQE